MAGGGGNIDQEDVNVVVFGAGITGLTVAHELAERRFKVWVVEPTFDVNRHGLWALAIGGMARTQYAAVNESATAANVMSPSRFPLARVAMNARLQNQSGGAVFPPHVHRYIERLGKPDDYVEPGDSIDGGGVLLRFLCEGGSNHPLSEALDQLLGERWRNRWEPESFETLQNSPTDSSVTLVRRARSVAFRRPFGKLSRLDARLLSEFLDYTAPGDIVDLSQKAEMAPPALLALLKARNVTVELKRTVTESTAATLTTKRKEIRIDFHKEDRRPEQGDRQPRLLMEAGILTDRSARDLRELQARLVSGDVIEIHDNKSDVAVMVAERIRKMLSGSGVTVLMPPADALLYPTSNYLSTHCLLTGEHGFRFFPSYYRHLRNTLRRVPTFEYDDRQIPQLTMRESGETVLDNLVNTPVQALAGAGTNPLLYPRCPTPSVGAVAYQLKSVLLDRGYDPRDIAQFIIRVVRYMSTGSKRRALELEGISWWQYLRGYDPMTGAYRFRYSDEFTRDLAESPRVLAAFDAEWGDAHTNGNTFVQLLLNQFIETEDVDQVLNGPTSEAWFEHWEQYLRETLGVRFIPASLVHLSEKTPPVGGLRTVTATLHSVVTGETVTLGQSAPINDPDLQELNTALTGSSRKYFVMAVDAKTAEEVTAGPGLKDLRVGVAQEIQEFESVIRASPLGDEPALNRGSDLKYGARPWDRFQTLTGIQFFFRNVTGIFDGHVYYMGAPWALSSINQQLFWRISLISRHAPYRGLLSADIGRFTDAWTLDAERIAKDTWGQIRDALRDYWQSDRVDNRVGLITPTWFHIDSTIDLPKQANRSPYLIPIVDDWNNRPCDVLFDPGEGLASPIPDPDDPARLWWAPWGGYRVHWDEWLFAGTYMRHFTRMTTMEAANESGRHAVNALLDHVDKPDPVTLPADFSPRRRYSTAGNPLEPHTAYVPTPLGDYCHIWDMENYELADLVQLRELDDWLVDQGLPHACDLVGGEVIPSMVSYLPSASELGLPTAADIIRALTPPFEGPGFQWPLGGINIPGPGSWPWPK